MCWTIPTIAAMIVYGIRRGRGIKSAEGFWLNLLLTGGAIFGIVDHLWHGELFLVSPDILKDLALGATITITIFAAWGIVGVLSRVTARRALAQKTKQ